MNNWLQFPLILNRGQLLALGAVAVLLALLIGGGFGYRFGSARGDARVATLQADFKQAQINAVATAESERLRQQKRADQLAAELAQTQADLQQTHLQLSRKVSHVTTVYLPAQASAPVALPPAVFTTGFVSVWNTSLGLPAAGETACRMDSETAGSEAVDAACLRDSGINQAEILNNHNDNAARCRAIEATLDKYIEWHKGL